MSTTTDLGRVREGSTGTYEATLKDEDGVAIQLASLTSLTLSLYDVDSRQIINERDNQDALNANNVTVHATSGLLTWSVQAADHAVVGTRRLERHRAVFEYRWNSGAKRDWHAVEFLVEAEPEVE